MPTFEKEIESLLKTSQFSQLISLLEEKIPQISERKTKQNYLLQLAESYYFNRNFSKSKKLAEDLLLEALQEKDHLLEGNLENLLGKIFRINLRYKDSLKHYLRAEKCFSEINDLEGLIKIYLNIANVYTLTNDIKKAKKFHYQSLKMAEKANNKSASANSYLNIGSMYFMDGETDNALESLSKAIKIFKDLDNEVSLATAYTNISKIYYVQQEFQKAIDESQKAEKLYNKHNNEIGIITSLMTIGQIHQQMENFNEAIDVYKEILRLDNKKFSEEVLIYLGECYKEQKNYKDSEKVFVDLLQLPPTSFKSEIYALDHLAQISAITSDYVKSIEYYRNLLNILEQSTPIDKDSIISTESNLSVILLKAKNSQEAWIYFKKASEGLIKNKNWGELTTSINNFVEELIFTNQIEKSIEVLNSYSIQLVKKVKNDLLTFYYYNLLAFIYFLKDSLKETQKFWQKIQKNKLLNINPAIDFIYNKENTDDSINELKEAHNRYVKAFNDWKSTIK